MTSIDSGSTYMASVPNSVVELSRDGSQATLVAGDPSNLTPTKLALYVYPDFSEAASKKVLTSWSGGHRRIQHPGGICLHADFSIRTNSNPSDPSAHAAYGHTAWMQQVKTDLLTRIQGFFDEAFTKEDKFDDKVMSCLEQAAKTAMNEYRPSQADSRVFKLVSIVPYKKDEESPPTIALDPTRQVGDSDVAFDSH